MFRELYRSLCPAKPPLTEKNLPDQGGKVFIVTGATSGVGEQLAKILYQHNAKVYVSARSVEKATKAINGIKAAHPSSKGELIFLHLDLNDLTTIKKTADEFLAKESRLDVLWLNAGVMVPPAGSKSAQGYELQLGTNNIAHFLLVKYLRPLLVKTAKMADTNTVRVVWVSSSAMAMPPVPAIDFDNMDYKKDEGDWVKYGRSKAGNVLHAAEMARQVGSAGIISVSLNPGNLRTDLQRSMDPVTRFIFHYVMSWPPIFGAYTELYAGLSREITQEHNGAWICPWGAMREGRLELHEPELGKKYWNWTEEQVKGY